MATSLVRAQLGSVVAALPKVGRALLAVGLLAVFVTAVPLAGGTDFTVFHSAGSAVTRPDHRLYNARETVDNPFWTVFKLPPSAALYLAPLGLLPYEQARRVWGILTTLAYFTSFVLLCRAFGVRFLSWRWLGVLAAWTMFEPARFSLREGQWDTLLLLLLALATLGAMSARPALAALPIGLAAAAKLHILLVALYFAARRWWTGLAMLVGALATLLAAGAVAIGPHESQVYLREVLPASGVTTAYPDNQALGGLIARLAVTDLRPVPVRRVPAVDLAIRMTALILCAAAAYLVWRVPAHDPLGRALQLMLFVPLAVLAPPVAWSHYQTILLLPLFVLAVEQDRRRPRSWPTWILLASAFLLAAASDPGLILGQDTISALWDPRRAAAANAELASRFPPGLDRLVLSYKTLGALMVLGLLAWRITELKAGSPATEYERPASSESA